MRVKRIKIAKNSLDIAKSFFLLGVFMKQFYLGSSGGFQIGDLCFMLSFIILIISHYHMKIPIRKIDQPFLVFVFFVIFINFIYIAIYKNSYVGTTRFHLSIIYYIYNLFIILTIRQFAVDTDFLDHLRIVLQVCLFLQLIFAVFHLGRYFDAYRYMGTFNDPNQCGFYIMGSFFMIFVLSIMTKKGKPVIWWIVAIYIIMKTSSTGMLMGMLIMIVLHLYQILLTKNSRTAAFFLLLAVMLTVVLVLVLAGVMPIPESIKMTFMYQRVMQKFGRIGIGVAGRTFSIRRLFEDRTWDRILMYPDRILYGAGEGYMARFPAALYGANEIHSSILGPIFYYGLIPCSFLLWWFVNQMHCLKKELWCVYVALLIESITLVNNRQPFFWMLFVLAGSKLMKNDDS